MHSSKQHPRSTVKFAAFHRDLLPVEREEPRILMLRRLRAMAYRVTLARWAGVDVCELALNPSAAP